MRIPVPLRSLRLRPTGDRVALVDPYGMVRHEVQYRETDVESGGMVLFQAETALDGYLAHRRSQVLGDESVGPLRRADEPLPDAGVNLTLFPA